MSARWSLLLLALILPVGGLAEASCDDAAAAATARKAIEATCPCATIPDARTYRSCARGVIASRLKAGTLPRSCRGDVRGCVRRSTCGRANAVTCCQTPAGDGGRCHVTDAGRCTASGGCIGAYASCCDACGAGGCNATTTTTLGPRNCGNFVIDANEQCDGEPFCQPDCFIPVKVCCQFSSGPNGTCSYDMDPPFICDPGYPNQTPVYGVTATGTGACTAGFGTDGPCGPPTTFQPTSICCEKPGACTTAVVSDTEQLTLRVLSDDCLVFENGQPLFIWFVGTCAGPDGPCIRGH